MPKNHPVPFRIFHSLLLVALSLVLGHIYYSFPPSPGDSAAAEATAPAQAQADSVDANFIPGGLPVRHGADSRPVAETVFTSVQSQRLEPKYFQKRIREIRLDPDLKLRPPAAGDEQEADRRFVFDLFDDVTLAGRVNRIERHGDDRAVYFGQLEDTPGDFILAYNEGAVVAAFSTPLLGKFQIRYLGGGSHAAIELDPQALPGCESLHLAANHGTADPTGLRVRHAIERMLAAEAAADPVAGGVYNGFGQQGGAGEGMAFTEVDVMIVHTTAATAEAGGGIGMVALIDVAVARCNSAFINSDVGIRLRLVRTEEVAYTEVDNSTDLSNLRHGNGALSQVAGWRDASGADLVSLFTTSSGGIAYLYNGSAELGFSVVGIGNTESTFAHEIGHNFGLRHDRENDSTVNPLYSYSHGWRFTPDNAPQLRTIMAYAPGRSIPYFSNPDITYMGAATGVPIGEALESDNAQALRQTKASVAQFRSPSGNQPPVVSLTVPTYSDAFMALEDVPLSASASDPDGDIDSVRFYRLRSDHEFGFTNFDSIPLGAVAEFPYATVETGVPAGFWTYAAVAVDDDGGIGVATVSITVAPHYRVYNHPLPDGKLRADIEAINESGRFVGFGHNGNPQATDVQAVYWEGGDVHTLDPLPGDTGARARAVSSSGVIFGDSISSGGSRRAVMWNHSSSPTDLSAVISGYTAESALGVDELGRVYLESGTDFRRYNDPGSTTSGLNERWASVADTGTYATGHDYNFSAAAFHAMRWQDGGTQLPPLAGYLSSWGRATNRSGAVIGFSGPTAMGFSSTDNRLTFWPAESTTGIDLGTFGDDGGWAYDLNDFNHGVGFANHPDLGGLGFVWKGAGGLIDLNRVILPDAGLIRTGRAINNRGQIAVFGFVGSDAFVALLDPLPGLDQNYWLASYFNPAELENPALTADTANPSGDGIPNLLKRAVGLDPRISHQPGQGMNPLPQASVGEDGHLYMNIRRLRDPGDLAYHPEASTTLFEGSWNTSMLEVYSITPLDDNFEDVVMRSTEPVANLGKLFARLRVSR